MNKSTGVALSLLFCTSLPSLVQADVLTLTEAAAERQNLSRPINGMSMEDVEAQFGTPLARQSPVGKPPITRWIYDDYTVYFEHQIVLHASVIPPAP